MADHHAPVTVSKESLHDAQAMWQKFLIASKYGIISIIVVLVLMALFLV